MLRKSFKRGASIVKVLMINSVCGIRSTGRICTDIATALTEEGYEVNDSLVCYE